MLLARVDAPNGDDAATTESASTSDGAYARYKAFFTELHSTLERFHRRKLLQFNASPLIKALNGLVTAMQ